MRVGCPIKRPHPPLLNSPLINQDETPVKVIHLPEPATSKYPFMFVQVESDEERRIVLYSYIRNRKKGTLDSFTKDYRGHVMTDGLKGYLGVLRII
ncbi:MAG: transposase [Sphaerochaetaceae bacterium]|nr:transposase [Sphaerochaetaceae bacterium]